MFLLHRLPLRPTPLLPLFLSQKSLPIIPLKTTSLPTAASSSSSSLSTASSRTSIPSRSSLCARFSSEALIELPKDEIEGENGEFGAETQVAVFESAGDLERVLEAGTNNKELKYNSKNIVKLPDLSVKEKKELASYAHSLGKKLKSQQVGKSGVTDTVIMALVETLEANELLKLKIHNNCPGELDDVVKQLEEGTGSVVVGRIGRTVILYRPSLTKLKAEEKKRQARWVLVKKQLTTRQFQSRIQRPRQSGRGHRGSSRASVGEI
ncbi:hypothetical protein ACH5RR_022009 [Cinchona calisaya]|uniref:CRM domain-containing protein n=1 Tax=Cinchona calisaya TaxID=153742 RepID=A0ABD2Z9T4_9GENT